VVAAAMLLVHLLQNRQDMRGMADHHRAMEALHKVAETPSGRTSARLAQPDQEPARRPEPVRPLTLSRLAPPPAPSRRPRRLRRSRRRPVMAAWGRPALVAALVLLVGTGVAGISKIPARSGHRSTAAVNASKVPPKPAPTPKSSPTTAPPATTLQPASEQTTALQPAKADARNADFAVGNAPFSVVVTAGGPCWLQVRTAAGQLLFSGTMAPGQIQTFSGTDLRLRLGAVGNVTMQVNGSSLVVPVRTPDPYNVRVAQTV